MMFLIISSLFFDKLLKIIPPEKTHYRFKVCLRVAMITLVSQLRLSLETPLTQQTSQLTLSLLLLLMFPIEKT